MMDGFVRETRHSVPPQQQEREVFWVVHLISGIVEKSFKTIISRGQNPLVRGGVRA